MICASIAPYLSMPLIRFTGTNSYIFRRHIRYLLDCQVKGITDTITACGIPERIMVNAGLVQHQTLPLIRFAGTNNRKLCCLVMWLLYG